MHNGETRAIAAEWRQRERLAADTAEEAVGPFEYARRAGHATLRELGREDRLPSGFGRRARLPIRQRADAGLIERNAAGDIDVDRVCDLLGRQLQHAPRTDRGREADDPGIID